jgi:hypothetical protein
MRYRRWLRIDRKENYLDAESPVSTTQWLTTTMTITLMTMHTTDMLMAMGITLTKF